MHPILFSSLLFAIWVVISSGVSPIYADDWPQILGPNRNGTAKNESLLTKWPQSGPQRLWKRECGQGYSGVAVSDNKVYLFHRLKTKDIAECLSATDGTRIWRQEFDAVYRGGFSSDVGPRCVPVVHKDSVYLYGAAGTLRRLAIKDGTPAWSRNLFEDFKANEGYFGAGSTPIIVDQTIVVIVGGREGGIVGLDLDGKTQWKTEPDTASYSAPVEVIYQGKKSVACVSKFKLNIVDVKTGKVKLSQDFGERGPTVNAAMPLVIGDKLFVSAAYRIGGRMLSTHDGKTIWENDTSMSSQYTTCVAHQGYLFGCNGREDFGNGSLRCVRVSDGKVIWDKAGFGLAHLIKVDSQALAWNIDGTLHLVALDSAGPKIQASTKIFSKNSKSLPALSNGRLFVKSNGDDGNGELICLQVGK